MADAPKQETPRFYCAAGGCEKQCTNCADEQPSDIEQLSAIPKQDTPRTDWTWVDQWVLEHPLGMAWSKEFEQLAREQAWKIKDLERTLSASRQGEEPDVHWLTADEVTEPGNYIREDSEGLCSVVLAQQRIAPAGLLPGSSHDHLEDALLYEGSFYRPDWGAAKFYGPVSLQTLVKDRRSINSLLTLLAKARRERDDALASRSSAPADTVTCDRCAFRYGGEHRLADGTYKCPVCELAERESAQAETVPVGEERWLIERTYAKGHPAERREFWLGVITGDSHDMGFAGDPRAWTVNALEAARFSRKDIAETIRYRHFHPEAPVEACGHMFQCGVTPELSPRESAPEELVRRIDAALKRITDGHAPMRVPVDQTDVDIVLADCKAALLSRPAADREDAK